MQSAPGAEALTVGSHPLLQTTPGGKAWKALSVARSSGLRHYRENTMGNAVRISVRVAISPYPGPAGDTAAQYAEVELKTPVLDDVDASPKGRQRVATALARALGPHVEAWRSEQQPR